MTSEHVGCGDEGIDLLHKPHEMDAVLELEPRDFAASDHAAPLHRDDPVELGPSAARLSARISVRWSLWSTSAAAFTPAVRSRVAADRRGYRVVARRAADLIGIDAVGTTAWHGRDAVANQDLFDRAGHRDNRSGRRHAPNRPT